MKTLKFNITAFAILLILISCNDLNEKKTELEIATQEDKVLAKVDTIKKMNLLDEQAKMLSKVLGNTNTEEGNALKNVDNYLDLLEQANFPPDVKKNILDQYKLYELSLDPKKKDSLKLMFNKKLNEAMAKSVSSK